MNRYYRSQVDLKKYQNNAVKKSSGGLFSFFKKIKRDKSVTSGYNRREDKTLSNPWRQKPKKNWKNIAALSASLLFILSWVGLMLFLPYFQINKLQISGQKITDPVAVESFVFEEYLNKNSNYFLTRKHKIEEGIKEKFGLQEVKIEKKFPQEIVITITEKMCSVIVYDGIKYHLLDNKGEYVTRILNDIKEIETPPEEVASLTASITTSTIDNELATSTAFVTSTEILTAESLNYKPDINLVRKNSFEQPIIIIKDFVPEKTLEIINTDTIQKIIEWQTIFKTKNIEEIKYFEVEKDNVGVKVFINRNWYIMFNPARDLNLQVENLESILSEFKPNEYVDLRFGEKIYWK